LIVNPLGPKIIDILVIIYSSNYFKINQYYIKKKYIYIHLAILLNTAFDGITLILSNFVEMINPISACRPEALPKELPQANTAGPPHPLYLACK
jgi:hypothetical protein